MRIEGQEKPVDKLGSVLNVNEEIELRKWKGKDNSEINLCCILWLMKNF